MGTRHHPRPSDAADSDPPGPPCRAFAVEETVLAIRRYLEAGRREREAEGG